MTPAEQMRIRRMFLRNTPQQRVKCRRIIDAAREMIEKRENIIATTDRMNADLRHLIVKGNITC